ncbi:MAG: GTPase ObgE [Candidatus Wallbacteria bacterium]|nr:GTPase ObgE [Candidatus Wallbacteria bacterium]
MFIDEVKVHLQAGTGGNGCVSFRREKCVPRGGPDGGDGGDGGSIHLKASRHLKTLIDLHYQIHYTAKNGAHGKGSNKTGKSAEDMTIIVPAGTTVFSEQGELLADLVTDGQVQLLAKGGRGGRGNARFLSDSRRAPRFSEKGEPGAGFWIRLELKLLADVGIVGFPNAGKSTLINAISNCKAKVADYPFTTLVPNLGVVKLEDSSFTVADIPGLIEGAHDGHGLGDRFLRHVERTRVILHLIDGSEPDLVTRLKIILSELEYYKPELLKKSQAVAISKLDLAPDEKQLVKLEKFCKKNGWPCFRISAVAKKGLKELLYFLSTRLSEITEPVEEQEYKVYRLEENETPLKVFKNGKVFVIKGSKIERVAIRIDFQNKFAMEWFYNFLVEKGVISQLKELGIKPGETVNIGKFGFEYFED